MVVWVLMVEGVAVVEGVADLQLETQTEVVVSEFLWSVVVGEVE